MSTRPETPWHNPSGSSREDSARELQGDDVLMHSLNHSRLLIAVKRAIDIIFSIAFFIILGWLYLILWIGVIFTSGAPALYSQPRYGKGGKVFKFYKFRSMVVDSDAALSAYLGSNPEASRQWNEFQKLDRDPRVTKFGRFIRRTSLDELPQFWNVLNGSMSLIGPRPCMIGQKPLYAADWIYYASVRPGLTGLWQVSGRNKLSYQARVELDVEYVKTLSIKKDLLIFVKTIWVVLLRKGSA